MARMNLKTYRARTMGDALAEVKKDLGKDAVILHTRTYRVGGWLGFGGRSMVEVTASDGVNVADPRQRRAAAQASQGRVSRPPRDAVSKAYGVSSPQAVPSGSTAPEQASPEVLTAAREVARIAVAAPTAPGPDAAAALEDELTAIKRMVGQVLQCTRQTAIRIGREGGVASGLDVGAGTMPDALTSHYLKLLESEVAAEIADEIIGLVRDELTPAELADESIVNQTVVRHLSAMIPADTDAPPPARPDRGDRPLTIALVGPTGVGKTTTVAKLAAAYKLRYGKKVALVTTDTYRIAAVDQLRTYAEIIGLPLKVALSPAEMAAACDSLSDCDVLLVDTAGRSQNDAGRLVELRQFIEAARPHQTHLVLSSTASERVLIEAAERFAQVRPDRVIFTKLDEAVNFGVILTVAKRVALRLSYVTTGQEVPDHIEVGRPERLARLIVDGARAR